MWAGEPNPAHILKIFLFYWYGRAEIIDDQQVDFYQEHLSVRMLISWEFVKINSIAC